MSIAQTILTQIKAHDFWALARWGANQFVGSDKEGFVQFKASGTNIARGGKIRISYMFGLDLYKVELYRIKGVECKLLASSSELYFDQLVETVEGMLDGDKEIYWKVEKEVA